MHHKLLTVHKFIKSRKKLHVSIFTAGAVFFVGSIALLTLNNQTFNLPLPNNNSKNIISAETANALGLTILAEDQIAVLQHTAGEPDKEKTKQSLSLSTGKILEFESDKATSVTVLEGNSDTTTYIKGGENLTIHSKTEQDSDEKKKIDPNISKKLKSKDQTVSVVIQFNLPFNKFYEPKQSADKIKEKNDKFIEAKSRVASKLTSKAKLKSDLQIINGVAADIDLDSLNELSISQDVKKVELDREVKVVLDTSLDQVKAKDVWGLVDSSGNAVTGIGKKIAIIDTGVDYKHPDLGGCLGSSCKVIGGFDFINNDSDPMDDHGHGTHVAATAAGKGLLYGVAPDANILAIKVLSSGGSGTWSQVISGIQYATDPNKDGDSSDHVDVASMSLGGGGDPDDAVSLAVDNSSSAGVVNVIAAGNSGPSSSTIASPGTARTAVTVAASCKQSQIGTNSYCSGPIASFSSRGPLVWNGVDIQKPDIAAPGVLICAARWGTSFSSAPTCFDSSHVRISGTSMATPHIAGVAALLLQASPSLTPSQVKQTLKSTARNLGVSYNDQGAGEVDAKAAIPISQKATSSPATWAIATDPSNKLSLHKQNFSITSTDSNINTLEIGFDLDIQGASPSASKNTLQVAGNTTDTFEANISIDNDIAKAGSYLGRIYLKEGGIAKASIPIFLTIKPTLTASPSDTLDYGIDDPSLMNWTSETKSVTLTNLRTDASQTLNVSSQGFPAGVNFKSPSSITVEASSSAKLDTSLEVSNSQIANGIYNGSLILSNPANSINLSTKFVKFYVLVVEDSKPSDLTRALPVVVHDRNSVRYYDYTNSSPRTFYLNSPGTYDVVISYFSVFDPAINGYSDFEVVKEGVSVSGGITNVTVSKNEAKNLVKIIPTDSNGATGETINKRQVVSYLPKPQVCCYFKSITGGTAQYRAESYFSNISNSYKYNRSLVSNQPANKIHFYNGSFTGLQDNMTFSNLISDFKIMDVKWDVDQQIGDMKPLIWSILGGGGGVAYYGNIFLTLPIKQTLYSLLPEDSFKFLARNALGGSSLFDADTSPLFTGDQSLGRWSYWAIQPLPAFSEQTVFAGLGPLVWYGKFANSQRQINFGPYFDRPEFLRQDYGTKPYAQIPVSIYKDDSLFFSSNINAFPSGGGMVPVGLITAGSYEFRLDFPYKNKSVDLTGKVRATFDTSLTDPNPPSLKKLYFYSDNKRSEQFEPPVVNKVEAEFDPVGGSLKTVGISYSKDGATFKPLTLTNTNEVYAANITPADGIAKLTVKISTTDNSGNNLTYSVELPVGSGSALQDTQAPTTSITSPADASEVEGIVNITAKASDNFGVDKVEIYIDDKLEKTLFEEPYSYAWDTSKASFGIHKLVTKAYDGSGNVASSDPITVTVVDKIAPTVSLSNPTNNATVSGTISISANASDNVGVTKVQFFVDDKQLGEGSSIPYSLSWDTTGFAHNSQHTIQAKALDAASNVGTSQVITVTVLDITAPSVSITSPTDGGTVPRNTTINIATNAADVSGVSKVEFYVNGKLVRGCSDTIAPYSCKWKVPAKANLTYTLQAKAYDTVGNIATHTIKVTSK